MEGAGAELGKCWDDVDGGLSGSDGGEPPYEEPGRVLCFRLPRRHGHHKIPNLENHCWSAAQLWWVWVTHPVCDVCDVYVCVSSVLGLLRARVRASDQGGGVAIQGKAPPPAVA